MGPRVSLSVLLVLCGVVLLAAIAVGNRMGNRVLVQVAQRTEIAPTPLLTPVAETTKNPQIALSWRRTQLVSVATDPAFPDPRVTPQPPAPAVAHGRRRRHAKPARKAQTPPPRQEGTLVPPEPPTPNAVGTPIPYETPQQ